MKYLIEAGEGIHALYNAAFNGHLKMVEYLKSVGAVYEGI